MVPVPSCGTGVAWTENILVPNLRWGDGCGYERWALETCSRPCFVGRSAPWRGAVPFRPDYVPSSQENARAKARRVCGVRLRERRLAWPQISCATSTLAATSGVMGRTTAWMVGLMNNFCVEIPLVVSVSEILLVVSVATLGSLFGLLPSTTNFLKSFIASTCLEE